VGPPLDADAEAEMERRVGQSVDVLGLSVRARNLVARMGCVTVRDLAARTPEEVLGRSFSETSLRDISDHLAALGLELGMARFRGTP
jgi:DNA-directed RNA polymerase alpha subunit